MADTAPSPHTVETADVPPNHTLYLNNLNDKIKADRLKATLYATLSQHGKILEIVMGRARRLRGQAWVTFDDIPSASNALRAVSGSMVFDKPVVVHFAKEKADVIARREGTFAGENGSAAAARSSAVSQPRMPVQNMPNKILFLEELPESCNKEMLGVLFKQYQGFKEVRMVPGKKGLAFVEFGDEAQAAIALQGLFGFKLTPTDVLKVSFAKNTTATGLEARDMALAKNTPEQLAEHQRVTQGKVRTRFPPEPNGYLHVGHAKSMNMNFFEAFEKLGVPLDKRETYFRYDDTNPEAESNEYIDAIANNELYELALKLVRKGRAYVCHQSKPEIEASRIVLQQFHATPGVKDEKDVSEAGKSPFRSRSVAENLAEFEKMRLGLYGEGEACLRMKMDLGSPNPNMWDHVAYRIKFVPHPHIGDKWCIYPTYDYTHCIVDALEHIDYSICTLEFETRRESYYWLLHELDLFKPNVYEFARLSMTYTVLSKRKLLKLVTSKTVRGWDDPRMGTLNGLRRRGFTPEIIKQFCKEIGVTRVQSTIQIERLYSVARSILGESSKRVMAVLDPVELVIENFGDAPDKSALSLRVPDYPQDVERDGGNAYHQVQLTQKLFLDRSDVRTEDSKDFYGVALNKQSQGGSACVLAPVYGAGAAERGQGLGVVRGLEELGACVQVSARDPESYATNLDQIVQFERIGYFVPDQDSTKDRKVFNQIVALRESGGEAASGAAASGANASRKDAQMQQLALKMEKMKLSPADMFKEQPELYSQFDAEGVPTHSAAGEELTKNQRKKLKKEQDKQKKLHDAYLAK
ncbi:Glutamyl/glutaminyl-tRNA synthetase, class Ib, alpha-bundle domain [Phytophthora cactorum]|nr:Glutamyl/glutaminyl-tRNA synthetase, class Ib, alpha-bundle domain [Phytophthora cactorum]